MYLSRLALDAMHQMLELEQPCFIGFQMEMKDPPPMSQKHCLNRNVITAKYKMTFGNRNATMSYAMLLDRRRCRLTRAGKL